MNCRTLVALILLCFIIGDARAEDPVWPQIKTLKHPEIAGNHIYAVCGKDGVRIWGLRNRIFVERENGVVESYSSENSSLAVVGTITDVAYANHEIWVAQTAPSQGLGVFKFDSQNWETCKFPDAPGLLNNYIVDIHVDKDEQIWFGHRFHGISRYVERVIPTFSNYKVMHLYDCHLLTTFMQLTHLWIGTTNGIVRLRTEQKSNYDLNVDKWVFPEFPAREAFSVCDYDNDLVIAGTSRGLAIFDGKKWVLHGKNQGIKALPVLHLQRNGHMVWIGSPAGLQLWSENRVGQLITEADGLPSSNITALALDENGHLLVGTEKGAAMLSQPPQNY
ncbi:MAG: two-component regulator propeller domain-containing protein [Candidatus Riflebacteria bacterium]|nr:two-component regulator propeller domain-containing protein [Candidatus Riflebacteria bacterium]